MNRKSFALLIIYYVVIVAKDKFQE